MESHKSRVPNHQAGKLPSSHHPWQRTAIKDDPIQISEKIRCLPPPSPPSLLVESQSIEIPRFLREVPPDFMVKFHFWYAHPKRATKGARIFQLVKFIQIHTCPAEIPCSVSTPNKMNKDSLVSNYPSQNHPIAQIWLWSSRGTQELDNCFLQDL